MWQVAVSLLLLITVTLKTVNGIGIIDPCTINGVTPPPNSKEAHPTPLTAGFKAIYNDCNIHKNVSCIGVGAPGCIESQSCSIFITHFFNNNNNNNQLAQFQMISAKDCGTTNYKDQYVAIAFSEGRNMGNDTVVACIKYEDNLNVKLMYAYPNQNEITDAIRSKDCIQIQNMDVIYQDNYIMCTFTLPVKFKVQDHRAELDERPSNIFAAVGPSKSLHEISYHHVWGSFRTFAPIDFTAPYGSKVMLEMDKLHIRTTITFHITCMTLTFITIIPTTILIARFLKESHVSCRVFHRKIWVFFHLMGNFLGICLVFAGQIGILVDIGFFLLQEYEGRHPIFGSLPSIHYGLGITITVLYCLQIVAGISLNIYLFERLDWTRRVVSFIHGTGGLVTYFFGIVQIFFAPALMPHHLKFCTLGSVLVLVWIFIHVSFFAGLTAILWRSDVAENALLDEEKDDDDKNNEENEKNVMEKKMETEITDMPLPTAELLLPSILKSPASAAPDNSTNKSNNPDPLANEIQHPHPPKASVLSETTKLLISKNNPGSSGNKGTKDNLKARNQKISLGPSIEGKTITVIKKKNSLTTMSAETTTTTSHTKSTTSSNKKRKNVLPKNKKLPSKGPTSNTKLPTIDTTKEMGPTNIDNKEELKLLPNTKEVPKNVNNVDENKGNPPNKKSRVKRRTKKRRYKRKNKKVASSSKNIHGPTPGPSSSIKNKAHFETETEDEDYNFQRPVQIQIVPSSKEVIFDDFPDYDKDEFLLEEAALATTGKKMTIFLRRDPRRALTAFPMRSYLNREFPRTMSTDIVIIVFFLVSLVISFAICYLNYPYQREGRCGFGCGESKWFNTN